jgi:hypothetical protein
MRLSCLVAGSLAAALLAGCAARPEPPKAARPIVEVEVDEQPEWLSVASDDDQDRIKRVEEAWAAAMAEARRGRFKAALAEEAELLKPDGALAAPAPPPGSYRCRVIRIGAPGAAYTAYKSFFCYVEAEGTRLNITKQTGSQRPAGWLYPDEKDTRLVFLGTLALGDEREPLPYGQNRERDMAGLVERVAPYRYRLVVPWPRHGAKLDVIELVPAPPQ